MVGERVCRAGLLPCLVAHTLLVLPWAFDFTIIPISVDRCDPTARSLRAPFCCPVSLLFPGTECPVPLLKGPRPGHWCDLHPFLHLRRCRQRRALLHLSIRFMFLDFFRISPVEASEIFRRSLFPWIISTVRRATVAFRHSSPTAHITRI